MLEEPVVASSVVIYGEGDEPLHSTRELWPLLYPQDDLNETRIDLAET